MDDVQLYLIRVWRSDAFRASVRVVGEEQTRLFDSPAALGEYLGAEAAGQVAATDACRGDFDVSMRKEPRP